jgi:trans-2,3-dihydro-3-hydroxyanthranilate isomerase
LREEGLRKLTFYTVDIFAESRYAGNQLAVFTSASSVSEIEMQKIAKEMNYSETTFVLSDRRRNGGYDVRIFTPNEEVPFAGHPTLGTAYVIQQAIIRKAVKSIVLNLKVGQVPVSLSYRDRAPDLLWMKQIQPTFGKTELPRQPVAQMLGTDENLIDSRFPIEEVSTGLSFIIIPLKSLDAVKRSRIDKAKYFEFIKDKSSKGVMVFCPETYAKMNQINARVFVEYYGIPEDPATGSANGCLAAYLVKHSYFGSDHIDNIRIEQGYEIGRPSLLFLKATMKGELIDVWVGGRVVMIAKGAFV